MVDHLLQSESNQIKCDTGDEEKYEYIIPIAEELVSVWFVKLLKYLQVLIFLAEFSKLKKKKKHQTRSRCICMFTFRTSHKLPTQEVAWE